MIFFVHQMLSNKSLEHVWLRNHLRLSGSIGLQLADDSVMMVFHFGIRSRGKKGGGVFYSFHF